MPLLHSRASRQIANITTYDTRGQKRKSKVGALVMCMCVENVYICIILYWYKWKVVGKKITSM